MSIVTVPEFLTPTPHYFDWFNHVSFLIDASGEKVAFIVRAPKAGTITDIGFRLGVVTTGQTLKVSLQDVDGVTGNPDGVVDQSNTVAVADTDDELWKTVTLPGRTVVLGEVFAIVIEFNAAI